MRALVHSSFGDPAEVMSVQDVPLPDPGPGQVRLQHKAVGLKTPMASTLLAPAIFITQLKALNS